LVVVAYTALLLLVVFALGVSLQSRRVGLAVVFLVICLPVVGFTYLGRSVFGEFPGLFFIFAGLCLWLRPGKRRLIELILIGFIFGCGAITKNQYAPIILGGIFVSWIADLFWYRRNGPLYYIIPGIIAGLCYGGWTYYTLFLLGAHERNVSADLQALRSTTSSALLLFNSSINNTNLRLLIQDNALLIPGLVWGLLTALRKDEREQRWSIIVLFLLIAAVMFIFSNGYARYEVAPQILGLFVMVRLVFTLVSGYRFRAQDLREVLRGKPLSLAATVTILLAILLIDQYVRPLYLQAAYVAASGTNAPYLVQEYLDTTVPRDAVIATYESSLGVLTDHAYKFASYSTIVGLTVKKLAGETVDSSLHNFPMNQGATYIITGPFSESVDPTLPERLQSGYDLIFKVDNYAVYRLKGPTF
jgi:hypothetical protein